MLDSETKRRIDSARDILVGKVPDPKSQVEQITIALIYKFMDDMDRQSIEMGGKASFFKGEFKKYGWGNIFDPRLGGVEMLNLYGEAITRMSQNANLPELFRNIFKNAYLPYRDPETLKLFLKTINDFTYDHSEKLGDAFEYLLSVLGSQGDAGQFRTPRHIIDFMVQVVDPKKNETVLDPACGTAGFLISAYKHIIKSSQESGKPLNAQDKQRLYENFTGYDISPDMVRLSLVNLYLHGFVKPQIHEYDSLASEERWNEYADVILANPPFMSPKGGIMPHKKFSVQSNRSEVLFVDYMAEHLTPNGRAAIIVPEGIIFQSGGAYKQLRKYLIEHNFLWAVISLPAGAFYPYSGVKTSILFLDKSLAKKTDKVLFVKVENDGFDLGAQRRPIDKNDLPQTLKVLKSFRASILDGKAASFAPKIDSALLVSISTLEESDYNLSADRYREVVRNVKQKYPMVTLGEIANLEYGFTASAEETGNARFIRITDISENGILIKDAAKYVTVNKENKDYLLEEGDLLVARTGATYGKTLYFEGDEKSIYASYLIRIRFPKDKVLPKYYWNFARTEKYWEQAKKLVSGGGQPQFNGNVLKLITFPLPSLEIQRQLVDEIAAHQRIIDGARQIIESWKPNFEIELAEFLPAGVEEWKTVKLSDVCQLSSGGTPSKQNNAYWKGNFPWVSPKDMKFDVITDTQDHISEQAIKESATKKLPKNSILVVVRSGILIHTIPVALTGTEVAFNQDIVGIIPEAKKILPEYLFYLLRSKEDEILLKGIKRGGTVHSFHSGYLSNLEIPLPPLEIQREIVARIETERAIVHGNRELIRLYEEKVKKVIERVWES